MPKPRKTARPIAADERLEPTVLRVIGGRLRGKKLIYHGQRSVRPMKERVRAAIFNLLGTDVRDKHVLDLFAGTGALGIEALSRGAARAEFFERHFPTARVVRDNLAALGLLEQAEVRPADTLIWFKQPRPVPERPWLVFLSPPYDLWIEQAEEMLGLLEALLGAAPAGSVYVAESDGRFDFAALPQAAAWDVREYPPARVGVFRPDETTAGE